MRRPKGIKTKKSVAKRFKITATGKVLRSHAGRRHLAQTKNAKRLRRLGFVPRCNAVRYSLRYGRGTACYAFSRCYTDRIRRRLPCCCFRRRGERQRARPRGVVQQRVRSRGVARVHGSARALVFEQ